MYISFEFLTNEPSILNAVTDFNETKKGFGHYKCNVVFTGQSNLVICQNLSTRYIFLDMPSKIIHTICEMEQKVKKHFSR